MSPMWILCLIFCFFLLILVAFFTAMHLTRMAQLQQLLALLICGFLQVLAGYFAFQQSSTGYLRKTAMDLKSNLEVSMACRVSTTANTSNRMRQLAGLGSVMWDNVVLIQCQVTIISVLAIAATAAYLYMTGETISSWNQVLLLLSIGLSASSLTCTVFGSLVTLVVSMLIRVGIDPDDMASSIAEATSDIIMILTFSFMSTELNSWNPETVKTFCWISTGIILGIFPFLLFLALWNPENRSKMKSSLLAILLGTIISLGCGFICEPLTKDFNQIPLIESMYNGFVGNCISIVISLLTTHFNRVESGKKGKAADKSQLKWFVGPKQVFYKYKNKPKISMTCRSHLLHVILPCQFVYLLAIRIFLGDQYLQMTAIFVAFYLFLSFVLLAIMIFISCNLVHIAVKLGLDADETVIPISTSLNDVCSSILLASFYHILRATGDVNAQIG